MKFYVKCTRYGSDIYVSYQGQSQDTIIGLLAELGASNIQFITEEEFNAEIAAQGK